MSLIATRLQTFRSEVSEFDKNMLRASRYGGLDLFVSQTDSGRSFITPDLIDKARRSIGIGVEIPVLDYDGDVQVHNVRTCVIADAENTSKLYTVVFATYQIGFTIVPTLYHNNEIGYQRDFNRKMYKRLYALANKLDQGCIAALEANKTQVYKDILYYTKTGNVINVPWEMRNEILGDLLPIMYANDYYGQKHIVGNAGIESMIRKLAQHGFYNAVNKQLEYAGQIFHFTNNVVNEEGVFASAFCVEDGNVGYVTRSGREYLRGARSNFHEFDIVNMPVLNIPMDSHYYTEVGNQSGIAGDASADMICHVKEFYGFELDIAFLVSYNSHPALVANPIMKLDIKASTSDVPFATPVTVVS